MIASAGGTKESRWVTRMIVRPRAIAARCCWMIASLSGSSELVASSNTSTGGSWISARDSQALALAARQIGGTLFEDRRITVRQPLDELVRPSQLGGMHHFLQRGGGLGHC